MAFDTEKYSDGLNSNPPFFLCLSTSFVFTNYLSIQRNASYNRAVRIMHRYCLMQHGFYVSNTIFLYFLWLEFKWHNDLETRHPWIWIASACSLVDSDFTNDDFLSHYPIQNHNQKPDWHRWLCSSNLWAEQMTLTYYLIFVFYYSIMRTYTYINVAGLYVCWWQNASKLVWSYAENKIMVIQFQMPT